jgi:hypothetical protein
MNGMVAQASAITVADSQYTSPAEIVDQVDVHVGEADIAGAVGGDGQPDHLQDAARPVAQHLAEGRAGDLRPGLHLPELRGVLQPEPRPQAQQRQGDAQQERQPPAPSAHLRVGQQRRDRADDGGGHREPQRRAGRGERAEEAAQPPRRGLGDVGGRPADLPARRESLGHPHDHQQDRRGDPGLRVGGQQSHQRAAGAHADDRGHQRHLAAAPVAEPAEEDPAERPHQVAGAEDRERRQEGGGGVGSGEEQRGEDDGQEAVHAERVVLDQRADPAGDGRAEREAAVGVRGHGDRGRHGRAEAF